MFALRGLEEWLRPYAEESVRWAEQYGLEVKITSVKRTVAQQQALRTNYERCVAAGVFPSDRSFSKGMSCKWPAARPGASGHQYGLAWDSQLRDPARRYDQGELDAFWVAVRRAFGWRVPEDDPIHAELPEWRSLVA